MSKPEELTPVETKTIYRVMEYLGQEFGLDFMVLVVSRNGVATVLSGGAEGSQKHAEDVKKMLRKGFHAMGVPSCGPGNLHGERN